MSDTHYLGIDLGTTNSAAAVFTDGAVRSIPNPMGEINTPSVVYTPASGDPVVGVKARRQLDSDPDNTFAEFKRRMGTDELSRPDRHGHRWSAVALSAQVLGALKTQAERECGLRFDKVVVTVPALFELPQNRATADAARLAGFETVELLPEPVASALAAGWDQSESGKAWMVFDLGGGTFDVSLLETRDGLLRVVAHDGDNFLGGRDIDRHITDWLLRELQNDGLSFDSQREDYRSFQAHLRDAAEQAKIRLSQTRQTLVEIDTTFAGQLVQADLTLTRDTLTELSQPLVDRAIGICQRLLRDQGLSPADLSRVVLVGGPAHMAVIRQAVTDQLAPIAEADIDPMALVSRGAALFAASIGLGCEPRAQINSAAKPQVWLQYPSVCSELDPAVMGRIVDDSFRPAALRLKSLDSTWVSAATPVDDSGIFLIEARVRAGKKNDFVLEALDSEEQPMPMTATTVSIVHGISLSDPPLSRSIGVALADGMVQVYLQRGTPLPAKRVFVQSTVETLMPGDNRSLTIPIVQGERRQSRFCRNVGNLVIAASELKDVLPAGSPVEITLEVDRGGDLKAQALLPDTGTIIEGVAELVMSRAAPDALRAQAMDVGRRIFERLQWAFRERNETQIAQLQPLSDRIQQAQLQVESLHDDQDSCQRLQRELMELDAEIEHIEGREQLAELITECEDRYFHAASWVNEYGDSADHEILKSCAVQLQQAMDHNRRDELERLIERLNSVAHSAHQKSPEYWKDLFLHWASFVHSANNPRRARKLVDSGHELIRKGEFSRLKPVVHELFALIPTQYRQRADDVYDSGIY